jgi:hypothetical protein
MTDVQTGRTRHRSARINYGDECLVLQVEVTKDGETSWRDAVVEDVTLSQANRPWSGSGSEAIAPDEA